MDKERIGTIDRLDRQTVSFKDSVTFGGDAKLSVTFGDIKPSENVTIRDQDEQFIFEHDIVRPNAKAPTDNEAKILKELETTVFRLNLIFGDQSMAQMDSFMSSEYNGPKQQVVFPKIVHQKFVLPLDSSLNESKAGEHSQEIEFEKTFALTSNISVLQIIGLQIYQALKIQMDLLHEQEIMMERQIIRRNRPKPRLSAFSDGPSEKSHDSERLYTAFAEREGNLIFNHDGVQNRGSFRKSTVSETNRMCGFCVPPEKEKKELEEVSNIPFESTKADDRMGSDHQNENHVLDRQSNITYVIVEKEEPKCTIF